jgi:hypothetical protein
VAIKMQSNDSNYSNNTNTIFTAINEYLDNSEDTVINIDIMLNETKETIREALNPQILYEFDTVFKKLYDKYSKFYPTINIIIDYLLTFNINVGIWGYRVGYNIAHYNLLQEAFRNGISPNHIDYEDDYYGVNDYNRFCVNPLEYIINSDKPQSEIIKIIDLFCTYGYVINEVIPTSFIICCKLDVIKHIINKITTKYDYLSDFIKHIDWVENDVLLKDKALTCDFLIKQMINDYGSVNKMDEDDYTPFILACNRYFIMMNSHHKYGTTYNADYTREYEYIIKQLLLNDTMIVDTSLIFDKLFTREIINIEIKTDMINKINNVIKEIRVTKEEAFEFIWDVSEYLIPDVANIVFMHTFLPDKDQCNLAHDSFC